MGTLSEEDFNNYSSKLLTNGGAGLFANEIEKISLAAQEGVIAY
jgi:hypothetical protein